METPKNYLDINKNSWNNRLVAHLHSEFYNQKDFLEGQNTLKEIELELLGNIQGKSILHLQCHFGQDTISLSRMGAKATGIDLSDKAIDCAKKIAKELATNTQFICCDVYSLPEYLDEKFDVVFTSYGTIGWLPDLNKWAEIIAHFLKPGGKLVFVEFHSVVWMFDDDFQSINYRYFNSGPIHETESGTYADKSADLQLSTVSWNHGLSEVIQNLIQNGLEIQSFKEYDYSPYPCFNHINEYETGKYRIQHLENKIPLVYSVVATKK